MRGQSPFNRVREPAAAGRFYPANAVELRRLVESLLTAVPAASEPVPKAVIVPHAGYIYSGPIAASAYARLVPMREGIRRIVLLGPSHFVAFKGIATASIEAFATPLGQVPVDGVAMEQVRALPDTVELEEAHADEHSLEVQLPFLQVLLKEFEIVPLVTGQASVAMVSRVIDALWGGPETRFVISSDLSHYLDSEAARAVDAATAQAIERLAPADISEEQACGRTAIKGMLESARQRQLAVQTLDLRNSGDTAGPRHRVVGYGAFAFVEAAACA